MKTRYRLALTAATLLAGCAQLPPQKPTEIALPPGYKEASAAPDSATIAPHWWRAFGDAELDALQQRLLLQSPDLAAALARHEQALAAVDGLRAAQSPTVSAGLDAQRQRQSERRPLRVLGPNSPDEYNSATASLGLSYEVDLWNRVRQRVSAGEAEARASAADLAGVRLVLQAQLADTWLAMRGLDAEVTLLRDTEVGYARALSLIDDRHRAGISSGLDLARAQNQLDSTRSQLRQAQARRALLEHAVAALVGESASVFTTTPATAADLDVAVPTIPVGVPSTLLQRRPDIAAAQQRIDAAAANLGVARKAFFPALTLSAQGGFQSGDFSRFVAAPNLFWAIGGSLAGAVFDGGRRQADVARAESVLDEAGARYRSAVLAAFQQVEDQLSLLARYGEAATDERSAVAAAARALALASNRYREGAASYLDVVSAQTAHLQARRNEIDLLTRQRRASVQLVRALGGGWSASPT